VGHLVELGQVVVGDAPQVRVPEEEGHHVHPGVAGDAAVEGGDPPLVEAGQVLPERVLVNVTLAAGVVGDVTRGDEWLLRAPRMASWRGR
jgi:hypothetical protein